MTDFRNKPHISRGPTLHRGVVPPLPRLPFTFSHPSNYLIAPTGTGQRYLVLMVLPADQALPSGYTSGSLQVDLQGKLETAALNANGFWQEATYGKTNFAFDYSDDIISLKDNWFDIYFGGDFRLRGSGAIYPIAWTGGEELQIACDNGFSVTVTFSGGPQTLSQVIGTVASAVATARQAQGIPALYAGEFQGQLMLQTEDTGPERSITVSGSAVPALGFSSPVTWAGGAAIDRSSEIIQEAIEKHLADKTDEESRSLLTQYGGIVLSYSGADTHYWPNAVDAQYSIRGVSCNFSTIRMEWCDGWNVFAHEIGHNLGLPDLYHDLTGEEVGPWDIMDNSGFEGSHPTAWIKAWKSGHSYAQLGLNEPWMTGSAIKVISAPAAHQTSQDEVLLLPTSCRMPETNPFATEPLYHAIRLESGDPNYSYYVEAREIGPFNDPTLGAATFDQRIPGNGVIVTDSVNDLGSTLVSRENVCLLTQRLQPLVRAGDEFVKPLRGAERIKISIKDVIGSSPSVYRVAVEWGPGSAYQDLRIEPWRPPPWESPDIWVDTELNGWDVYLHSDPSRNPDVPGSPVGNGDQLRVNWPARLYARVWNDGDRPASNVVVDFSVVVPAGSGLGVPIGSFTIANIPPQQFAIAMVTWTPKTSNEGHVCVQASIQLQSGEANENNNWAQENITDWYLEGGSPFEPVEVPFQIRNPLDTAAHIRLHATGLRPGFHLTVPDVEFWLAQGGTYSGIARLIADASVPVERAGFTAPSSSAPLISLYWSVHKACNWEAFGGISGWAHAVRKTSLGVVVEPLLTAYQPRVARLRVTATTSVGPVIQAGIAMRLIAGDGATILCARGSTGSAGSGVISVTLPEEYPVNAEYEAEVVLLPSVGVGPAECTVPVRFGRR